MKKGDIYLVEIPFLGGHEQEGTRPAIILADTATPVIVIIPCTSNTHALRFPFTLRIENSKSNGFKESSIALTFHLRSIDKSRLKKKIGSLETKYVQQLNKMIKQLLDIK
ncbi:MAG: type II toxin-antitoxin system PemK/MazF family toxin [Patescibacteria group bacterium]